MMETKLQFNKTETFDADAPLKIDSITIKWVFDDVTEFYRSGGCMMGCYAECQISYPIGQGSRRMEWLQSGGLWGIDSPEGDYAEDIQHEEYNDLVEHIKALGIDVKIPTYEECEISDP